MFGGSHIMLDVIMNRIWRWAKANKTGETFLGILFKEQKIERKETSMEVIRVRSTGIVDGGDLPTLGKKLATRMKQSPGGVAAYLEAGALARARCADQNGRYLEAC
jgi:hypothetical protein